MVIRDILEFFVGLVPTFEIPSVALNAFSNAGQFIANVNYYIPIPTFIICASAYFVQWLVCAIISAVLQLL